MSLLQQQNLAVRLPQGDVYQSVADHLPRGDGIPRGDSLIGGPAPLPAGDVQVVSPFTIGSGVELIGTGPTATRLIYSGKLAAAVRLFSYADNKDGIRARVRNLTINSAAGAIDIMPGYMVENVILEGLTIMAGGDGISFDASQIKDVVGRPTVRDVLFSYVGGSAIIARCETGTFERIDFAAPARPLPKTRPAAMVDLTGSGELRGCRFEGKWNCPKLRLRGSWTLSNNYFEASEFGTFAILEGPTEGKRDSVTIDFAMACTPDYPWIIRNQMDLVITGDSRHGNSGGGAADPKDCFKCENGGRVFLRGRQIVPELVEGKAGSN